MSDSAKLKAFKPLIKEQQSYYEISDRFEIINGVRYDLSPSPKYVHQKLIANLYYHMRTTCEPEGEILLAPMDVHFDEDNLAQPDLLFISNSNRSIIRDGFIYGAPDLVVEVLSSSTGKKDKTVKKEMFERFGVKEYVLFDPVYRTVDQFVLTDGSYRLAATYTDEDTLTSPHLICMSLQLKDVFPPEDPNEVF